MTEKNSECPDTFHQKRPGPSHALLLLLIFCVLCLSCAEYVRATETAATIRLVKTEGTVEVTDSSMNRAAQTANMRLFSGNHVLTKERSYAWLNLDDTKAIKEDAVSETELRKSGNRLEVLLNSGNLFFNVSEPLQQNETLNIRTSTMVMGIRGTCGWVKILDTNITRVYLLEGSVWCSVTNPIAGQRKSIVLKAGDVADFYVYDPARPGDKCDIIIGRFTREDIDGFVLTELAGNDTLCRKIRADSGLNLQGITADEAAARLAADQQAMAVKLDAVSAAENLQDRNIAKDPVWEWPAQESASETSEDEDDGDDDDEDDDDDAEDGNLTMPQKVSDIQRALNRFNTVNLNPGSSDNTLDGNNWDVGTLTVPAGKTLNVASGVAVTVPGGSNMTVNGTANLNDTLTNEGTTTVNSSNSLRIGKLFTNSGTLQNTKNGRTEARGGIDNSGTIRSSGKLISRGKITISDGSVSLEGDCDLSEKIIVDGGAFKASGTELKEGLVVNNTVDPDASGGGTADEIRLPLTSDQSIDDIKLEDALKTATYVILEAESKQTLSTERDFDIPADRKLTAESNVVIRISSGSTTTVYGAAEFDSIRCDGTLIANNEP